MKLGKYYHSANKYMSIEINTLYMLSNILIFTNQRIPLEDWTRVYVRKRRYTTNITMLSIVYSSKYIVCRDVVDPIAEHSLR